MACSRGKANPSDQVRFRLFAESAGRCQKPDCLRPLFIDSESKSVHIAEAAHIIAANDGGARTNESLARDERGAIENLILLCPSCHKTIDKLEEDYPVELLIAWKEAHQKKIESAFGLGKYKSRPDAREQIDRYLAQNKAIFDTYGPMSEHRFNPESEIPAVWRKKVRDTILPNNRAILHLMDANRHLLTEVERSALEQFRIHTEDLELRHLQDPPAGAGMQFPKEIATIFTENEGA